MKARNILPEPVVIGRRLKPYTLGHDLLLHAIDSGFAIGTSEMATYPDLLISVYLCSFHFEDAVAELTSKKLKKRLKKWGAKQAGFDEKAETTKFIQYLKAYTDAPDYWLEDKGGSHQCGSPLSQILKVAMMRDFHVPKEVALNMPFCEAQSNYLTSLELNGRLRLATEEDMAAVKAASDPDMDRRLQEYAKQFRKN